MPAVSSVIVQGLKRACMLIQKWEGFRPKPYLCPAGKWTIGYGHLIVLPDGKLPKTRTEALSVFPEPLSQDKALRLLKQQVRYFWEFLQAQGIPEDLQAHQIAALVSWCYNVGITRAKSSTLLRLIKVRDYAGAALQFPRWVYVTDKKSNRKVVSKGLVNRRREEASVFRGLSS